MNMRVTYEMETTDMVINGVEKLVNDSPLEDSQIVNQINKFLGEVKNDINSQRCVEGYEENCK